MVLLAHGNVGFSTAPAVDSHRACRLRGRDGKRLRTDTSRLVVELGNELIANSGNRLMNRAPWVPSPSASRISRIRWARVFSTTFTSGQDSLEQFILGEDSTSVLKEM